MNPKIELLKLKILLLIAELIDAGQHDETVEGSEDRLNMLDEELMALIEFHTGKVEPK